VTTGLGVAEGLGVELADGVGVGVVVGLADGVGVGVIVGLADGVGVRVVVGLAGWVGVRVVVGLAGWVGVGVVVGLAGWVGVRVVVGLVGWVTVGLTVPGENGGGVAEDTDPEQAETAAEANIVKATQPAAAKLAPWPVPMMVVRIFMAPPHASGRWRARFPVPVSEEKSQASRDAPGARRPKARPRECLRP
jgi:hypothetical protein